MRAEIERLKTMKSIDQAIIQSQVTELTLARAEALQLRQEIQLQSDCSEGRSEKKIQYERSVAVVVVFFSFKISFSPKTKLAQRFPLLFFLF